MSTRLLSRVVTLLLRVLTHARIIDDADLGLIMTNNFERLLNLPGKLSFLSTKTIDAASVKALINKLHPVACSSALIRLGPDGDGGYLVPNDLEGIEACFSPGVSDRAGFEVDCAERGMNVFMADGSVEKPPTRHPRFTFIQRFVGASTQGNFMSLDDWISDSLADPHADLLLQMDIEGYEYETLLSAPNSLLQRFRIMVVEFHALEYLFSEPIFPFYCQVFAKILRSHTCVHIHPNNVCPSFKVGELEIPQLAEFTFLRNDRISEPRFAIEFPHPLDRDNTDKASFSLPNSLYAAQ